MVGRHGQRLVPDAQRGEREDERAPRRCPICGALTSTTLAVGASTTPSATHSRNVVPVTDRPKKSCTRYPAAAAQKAPRTIRRGSSERPKTVRNDLTPAQTKMPYIMSIPGMPMPAASCSG